MRRNNRNQPSAKWAKYAWGRWTADWSTYRVLRKFTRMPWHKKKEKRDDAWKIARGVYKDEKKCCNGQHHTYGWDKWTKFFDKRQRRRFEKKMLYTEKYSRLEQSPSSRRYEDRWNWD